MAVDVRLASIERRLSRIEGGLLLAGFLATVVVAIVGRL